MSSSTKSFLRVSNATGIHRFGEHLTWIQEPDIFHMRLVGTLEADEFKAILEWQAKWGKDKPRFFVVSDVSQLKSISRDARKYTSEQGRITPTHAVTITYGASFAVRVMADMSTRARKVLGMPDLADVVFVETQADALAELEKRRIHG
jgi:hypothetical protein